MRDADLGSLHCDERHRVALRSSADELAHDWCDHHLDDEHAATGILGPPAVPKDRQTQILAPVVNDVRPSRVERLTSWRANRGLRLAVPTIPGSLRPPDEVAVAGIHLEVCELVSRRGPDPSQDGGTRVAFRLSRAGASGFSISEAVRYTGARRGASVDRLPCVRPSGRRGIFGGARHFLLGMTVASGTARTRRRSTAGTSSFQRQGAGHATFTTPHCAAARVARSDPCPRPGASRDADGRRIPPLRGADHGSDGPAGPSAMDNRRAVGRRGKDGQPLRASAGIARVQPLDASPALPRESAYGRVISLSTGKCGGDMRKAARLYPAHRICGRPPACPQPATAR